MDEAIPHGDTPCAYRVGPRCGGGNLGSFSSGRPRRGQAAAPLVLWGDSSASRPVPMDVPTPGQGLTAITPAASETRGGRRGPGRLLSVVNDAALHPAGNRDDLAGDVAGELVRG